MSEQQEIINAFNTFKNKDFKSEDAKNLLLTIARYVSKIEGSTNAIHEILAEIDKNKVQLLDEETNTAEESNEEEVSNTDEEEAIIMDKESAIEDVASDVSNSGTQGPEPTCGPIEAPQQSEKLICRYFKDLSADTLMRDGINKLRKVFDEGTQEDDNVNNFFELIEKSANTTLYKNINFYMNLNNCYEELSNKVFIAHVKKAICSMAYARDLESLLKSGSNYYYEVIEAVGGENKHQKLKRLGDRMIKLIHQCGVGSLLLLQYVSLSQIQKFRNDQFDVILCALQKDYHFVWDEFRAALDSCLLTKLVKRITGDISLSFSAVPSSVGAMTTPAQLEDQGPATMITAVPSRPPNLNLNEALPAVGSKRTREESSN